MLCFVQVLLQKNLRLFCVFRIILTAFAVLCGISLRSQYMHKTANRPACPIDRTPDCLGDGIPLAFSIHPGNTNEQTTLKPLEEQIVSEFGKKKFIVCTDAGLSSAANRKFNDAENRAFITVQSLKKMKGYQKEWALGRNGWKLYGSDETYSLDEIENNRIEYYDRTFYKEEWFKEDGLEQRFIVTYSLKYKEYLAHIRERQIQRAEKSIATGAMEKHSATDPKRFVWQSYFTENGEIAEHKTYTIDEQKIRLEAMYDGFYCTATNLEDSAETILKVNQRRWEIEENFRLFDRLRIYSFE